MASLVLGTIGKATFGPIGGFIGALAGSHIDAIIGSQLAGYKTSGSRLSSLKLQTAQDGAFMPIIYGKGRISGQLIWASAFKETTIKRQIGGKTGQKTKENYYSISFALGLCEGPISGIGQIWINGEKAQISEFEHRLYLGKEGQEKDPLIEAVMGTQNTPNYKGMAYIVFEDLPLGEYGDRIPQFSFEVFSRPESENIPVEEMINAVCLIPGAGEFCYAATPIIHKVRPGKEFALNNNQSSKKTDLLVSLDNLLRDLPNVSDISLVAAWFGDDLRAGNCQIMPRVDSKNKPTKPRNWSSAGLTRETAPLVTNINGAPAYGGSPDDISIIEAIKEIKSRGINVTFNPFIMMDIAQDNALANPYGGLSQGAYPWRGRISCYPSIDQANSADNTLSAQTQIDNFFGSVEAGDFGISNDVVNYNGPNQWSYSRFILHMAAICKAAGGVSNFLIGSEMVGLTRVRGALGQWVFVNHLNALAQQVRIILGPTTKISYGADWTEYGAYYDAPNNSTYFPLDALWASNNIDFIGVDYYAPLSDRGPNDARLTAAEMTQNIEAGEGFDYYYANEPARQNRQTSPIIDTIYNEPWIYRQKDIRSFWANAHYERVGGIRQTSSTPWIAKSKPIRFMEFGLPAINRGANRPSVFPDAKSIENGIPPFSTNARDDSEQKNGLLAFLNYWKSNNQFSQVYQADMIDAEKTFVWAWDARPYPAFPANKANWADNVNYEKGHWLMGRMGRVSLAAIVKDINKRAAVNCDVGAINGQIDGYIIEQSQSARTAIEPLMAAFGIETKIQNHVIVYKSTPAPVPDYIISNTDLIVNDNVSKTITREATNRLSEFRFGAYAIERDYEVAKAIARNQNSTAKNAGEFECAIICDDAARAAIAARLLNLNDNQVQNTVINLSFGRAIQYEIGDRIRIGASNVYMISNLNYGANAKLELIGADSAAIMLSNLGRLSKFTAHEYQSAPFGFVLDLPFLFASLQLKGPIAFCAATPWPVEVEVKIDDKIVGYAQSMAKIGKLAQDLQPSKISQKLNCTLKITMDFGALETQGQSGAILQDGQIIDIINWQSATLIGLQTYELSGIVRGLNGIAYAPYIPFGAVLIVLDNAKSQLDLPRELWNLNLSYGFSANGKLADNDNSYNTTYQAAAGLPWAVCHIKAARTQAGVNISFISRTGGTKDGLEAFDELNAKFQLEIITATDEVARLITIEGHEYLYSNAQELSNFVTPQASLKLRITQISQDGRMGASLSRVVSIV